MLILTCGAVLDACLARLEAILSESWDMMLVLVLTCLTTRTGMKLKELPTDQLSSAMDNGG